jgi:hypothetical protein
MNRNPLLAQRGVTEQLGMGKAMPGEVVWRAKWLSPVATATTIQNQTSKSEWTFH